jgi:glycosyltransferase involved in cell wall biosynthesis
MNCSFDSGAVRTIYRNNQKKCFVSQPNLIIADVSTSDIRSGRNQAEFSTKMKWDLTLYDCAKHQEELVSVIMPAYNAEKTIEKSIRSVLMQTHRNLELIVADDGSTDGTADIVEKIAAEDNRVKLLRNAENRGCYFVRNDALRVSKGNYIAIQDADDISLKDRLEKQLIPIVSGNALIIVGQIIRSNKSIEFFDPANESTLLEIISSQSPPPWEDDLEASRQRPGLNTTMFHRSIFSEYGLFWENRFGSDAEIIERIIYKKTGIVQPDEEQTIHDYFTKFPAIPEIYAVIDDVLLISPEMNRDNLSNQYQIQGLERKEFRKKYRDVLLGKADYQYPVF